MINSPVKRFILPFSPQKNRDAYASEVEAAAVYALAELERAKGGGLVVKQPEEKLSFIAQLGYPLWVFPNYSVAYIFDGINNFSYSVPYAELPFAKDFMERLETNSRTREDYMSFLSDNRSYFLQQEKEKEFPLKNLINDLDFKRDFDIYRKESNEVAGQFSKLVLLPPSLQETTVTSMITEMNKLQSSLKEDAQKLQECLRRINKTTSLYVTELYYAAESVKDEADAKFKAQEELVNPQIIKLRSEYKKQTANVTRDFEGEIEKLMKLNDKTSNFIEDDEKKIKRYEREAKKQAEKNHLIYENRWKAKIREVKQELNGFKKEIKRIDDNIKNLNKQKNEKLTKLQLELDAEIKLARQPLLDLEVSRDAKLLVFKRETEKLVNEEKPLIEGLNNAIALAELVNDRFQMLGVREPYLKTPALFYVPFYVACFHGALNERYLFFAPSTTNSIGFAAKLKGVMGIAKVKEIFTPRFKSTTNLIEKIQVLTRQDSALNHQINELGEKNNLLKNDSARINIERGLVYLKDEGWLSEREYRALTNSLAQH
jgi:hypothetical protein